LLPSLIFLWRKMEVLKIRAKEKIDKIDKPIQEDVLVLATVLDSVVPRIAEARTIVKALAAKHYYIVKKIEEIPQSYDKKPAPNERPFCQYPRWSAYDKVWLCCHGGTGCGACSAYPDACESHPDNFLEKI